MLGGLDKFVSISTSRIATGVYLVGMSFIFVRAIIRTCLLIYLVSIKALDMSVYVADFNTENQISGLYNQCEQSDHLELCIVRRPQIVLYARSNLFLHFLR